MDFPALLDRRELGNLLMGEADAVVPPAVLERGRPAAVEDQNLPVIATGRVRLRGPIRLGPPKPGNRVGWVILVGLHPISPAQRPRNSPTRQTLRHRSSGPDRYPATIASCTFPLARWRNRLSLTLNSIATRRVRRGNAGQ